MTERKQLAVIRIPLGRPHPAWLGKLHVDMLQGLVDIVISRHKFDDRDGVSNAGDNKINHFDVLDWHILDKTVDHIRNGGKFS